MNRVDDVATDIFARHETFHPRYGWFRKAVKAAEQSPQAFTREDAPVELGVGKNMVRALRFWGKAAKLLAEVANPTQSRGVSIVPSWNGVALFGDAPGLDPYLELPGTLWLLHWWMLSKPSSLPVWWIALNQCGAIEFSAENLLSAVLHELQRVSSWQLPVEASIKKDVDCFLRMYAPRVTGRFALDDLLDCPFRELGLLETVWDEAQRYRFVVGPKPTLPIEIIVYACLDYLATTDPGGRTITLNRLASHPASPGRIFKLTEEDLVQALDQPRMIQTGLLVTASAGIRQLAVDGDPRQKAVDALESYYQRAGSLRATQGSLILGEQAAFHKRVSVQEGRPL